MDILDVCITGIVSEEELNRVVRVTIDTDCWGQTARVTGAFFKNDWEVQAAQELPGKQDNFRGEHTVFRGT
jgi:hypothetical protein